MRNPAGFGSCMFKISFTLLTAVSVSAIIDLLVLPSISSVQLIGNPLDAERAIQGSPDRSHGRSGIIGLSSCNRWPTSHVRRAYERAWHDSSVPGDIGCGNS